MSLNTITLPSRYWVFVITYGTSLIGSWLQRVSAAWLVWQMTGSPTWVGVLSLSELGTSTLAAPIAGAVADRLGERAILKTVTAIAVAYSAILSIVVSLAPPPLFIWVAGSILVGILNGFQGPARFSFIASLVEKNQMTRAAAYNSLILNTAVFVGPVTAGFLLGTGPAWVPFALNAFATLTFLATLTVIQSAQSPKAPIKDNWFRQISSGFMYTIKSRALGPVFFLLIAVSFSARCLMEMMPSLVGLLFDGYPSTLSLLSGSIASGAFVGGLAISRIRNEISHYKMLAVAGFLSAVTLLVFAGGGNILLAVPVLFTLGASLAANGIASETIFQMNVEPPFRGRAMSLYGMAVRGAPALGAVTIGSMFQCLGLSLSLTLSGFSIFVCTATFIYKVHSSGIDRKVANEIG
ncbi:MFS transporter [Agrobacterium vitis]|uniref:MFS transporter n=1 Tax=Agrobacterium vitis TaxID=373 RepID=UPI0015D688F1|nr:MFS transporter [Agrobacterium vitis]